MTQWAQIPSYGSTNVMVKSKKWLFLKRDVNLIGWHEHKIDSVDLFTSNRDAEGA